MQTVQMRKPTEPRDAPPDPADIDARLVEALRGCAAGEFGALAELYRMTASRLLGQLARMLPDRAEAEDALQECYLRIWQRAGQFDPSRGRPLTWMLAIARHHAIDTLRARRVTVPLDDVQPDLLVDPAEMPWVESSATSAALRRGLAALSVEQQCCLRLAYGTGQSHEEIARGLGYPLGSVKSWIRRGLLTLREHLEAWPEAGAANGQSRLLREADRLTGSSRS